MKKLTLDELLEFVRDWEHENGESFMDYAGDDYIFLNVAFLLGYWSVKYPELYQFLMKESGNTVPWRYPQDGLTDLVEFFYNVSHAENWSEDAYNNSLKPWLSLIIDNDIYYKRFEDWKVTE